MQNWTKTTWASIGVGVGMAIVTPIMFSLFPGVSHIWVVLPLLFCAISLILICLYSLLLGFIYKCFETRKIRRLFIIILIMGFIFGGFLTWLYIIRNPALKELLDVRQYDSQRLNDVIFVTDQHARLGKNSGGEPYIDFHLFVFNGSVFTIYFNRNIKGNAVYEQIVLKDVPKLERPDSNTHFAHGEKRIHVTLRQWLPLNIKDKIIGENKTIVDFGLDGVDIFIETVNGLNVNNSKHRLELPMRFQLRL